jgi:AcrR family transcriptional regulator
MSDLRKKQKRKREEAIVAAAKKLITEKGYRNTSIEEIAEQAEVGPATVYNYFNSKAGIFLAIFKEEVAVLLKNGEKITAHPPDKPEEAVFKLVGVYFGDFLARYSKKMLREILVIFLIEQLSVRKDLLGLDYVLMSQITSLLNIYKNHGQIKPELDTAEIALIIYTMIMGDIVGFIVDDDMTLDNFLGFLQRQISILFDGFSP